MAIAYLRRLPGRPGPGYGTDDIEHGLPDTKTFARQRVDPPAGCRAAAEPAS